MKRSALSLALVVLVPILAVCGLVALGAAPKSLALQSATPAASPLIYKIYLPVTAHSYKGPPPPFLRAPYYGTQWMSSVFDHDLPDYSSPGNGVTPYSGITSTSVLSYEGHPGYDYVLVYDPVLAAANGTVDRAQWYDPTNHRAGFGLYVRIQHDDGYSTEYGHLSAVAVDIGAVIDDAAAGRVIGISGNTGYASSNSSCDPNRKQN